MRRIAASLLAAAPRSAAAQGDDKTHIYLQRFFGECGAEYGASTDVSRPRASAGS
jgi:multiple sugar transport system substrate-binding protein